MNDSVFIAKLYSNDLLPGGMKATIESIPTASQRTTKLLDNVIKPAIDCNNASRLCVLLEVMKNSEDDNLRRLAGAIMSALREGLINNKSASGMLSTLYICEKHLLMSCHVNILQVWF